MSQSAQKARGWLVGIAVLCGIWLIQNGSGDQLIPPQPSSAQAFAAGPQLQPGSPVAEPLRPPTRSASASRASRWTRR